jgi:hypothetical protein
MQPMLTVHTAMRGRLSDLPDEMLSPSWFSLEISTAAGKSFAAELIEVMATPTGISSVERSKGVCSVGDVASFCACAGLIADMIFCFVMWSLFASHSCDSKSPIELSHCY